MWEEVYYKELDENYEGKGRNKKNQFVPYDTPTARFRWEDMQRLEKFNELKQLLSKKKYNLICGVIILLFLLL